MIFRFITAPLLTHDTILWKPLLTHLAHLSLRHGFQWKIMLPMNLVRFVRLTSPGLISVHFICFLGLFIFFLHLRLSSWFLCLFIFFYFLFKHKFTAVPCYPSTVSHLPLTHWMQVMLNTAWAPFWALLPALSRCVACWLFSLFLNSFIWTDNWRLFRGQLY